MALENAITVMDAFERLRDFGKSGKPELVIEQYRLSGMPPQRLGFSIEIDPAQFEWNQMPEAVGSVGSCRLFLSVRNRGNTVASIRSIIVRKRRSEVRALSSFLSIPQGGDTGEPWRFVGDLERDPVHMRRLHWSRGQFEPMGDADYFEHGRIQIEPDHVADIVVVLHASHLSYSCSLALRAESSRLGTYIVDPPIGSRDFVVVPLSCIPEERRYQLNYSGKNPLCHEREFADGKYMYPATLY